MKVKDIYMRLTVSSAKAVARAGGWWAGGGRSYQVEEQGHHDDLKHLFAPHGVHGSSHIEGGLVCVRQEEKKKCVKTG